MCQQDRNHKGCEQAEALHNRKVESVGGEDVDNGNDEAAHVDEGSAEGVG